MLSDRIIIALEKAIVFYSNTKGKSEQEKKDEKELDRLLGDYKELLTGNEKII